MRQLTFTIFLLLSVVVGNAFATGDTSAKNVYNVVSFGAKGDGVTDDAAAIQQAIDRCAADGGGQVYFPVGKTFLAGPLQLKGNTEIYLDFGSVLKANPDESIYHLSAFGDNQGEGMLWLWANAANNISFRGHGTIDGNGIKFMGAELADSYELKPLKSQSTQSSNLKPQSSNLFDPRPHVLTLFGCDKVSVRDITIKDGAYWTVHLVGCNDVVIDGINLLNNLKIRNGDGIDIDHSKNVRVSNCHITSGDDCICLKNRREFEQYGSCHDIVVNNCTMTSRSCAIKIGSENMDSIYNVSFDNCVITASNRGLGIQNRDEGTVTDVSFSNIILDCRLWSDVWWGKAEPIYVTSYPRADGNNKDANWRFPKGESHGRCGEVSRIFFTNIFATSENGCFIGGDTKNKVNNVFLKNVHLNLKKLTGYKPSYDKRPCRGEGFINGKVYGVYIDNDCYVDIDDLEVRTKGIDYGGDTLEESKE